MQMSQVMTYNGASNTILMGNLAFYGIFVAKEMEHSIELRDLIFNNSVNGRFIGGYGLKKADYNRIVKNLEQVGGLKNETDFLQKKGQNDLRKSLKYTILMKLCNSNYFGAKMTQHIGSYLCNNDKEYANCIGSGEYFFIPRLSESVQSLVSIGYSRMIKKYLDKEIITEVYNQFKEACRIVKPDFENTQYFKGHTEDIMISAERFLKEFEDTKNLFDLYPFIDTENEVCKHIWFLEQ